MSVLITNTYLLCELRSAKCLSRVVFIKQSSEIVAGPCGQTDLMLIWSFPPSSIKSCFEHIHGKRITKPVQAGYFRCLAFVVVGLSGQCAWIEKHTSGRTCESISGEN